MNTDQTDGKPSQIRVQQDGLYLFIIFNEKEYCRVPYQVGMEIANAIKQVAKLCEAEDHVAETIKDQELLIGLGIPIQLPFNKHCALAGIKSSQVVGEPKLIIH